MRLLWAAKHPDRFPYRWINLISFWDDYDTEKYPLYLFNENIIFARAYLPLIVSDMEISFYFNMEHFVFLVWYPILYCVKMNNSYQLVMQILYITNVMVKWSKHDLCILPDYYWLLMSPCRLSSTYRSGGGGGGVSRIFIITLILLLTKWPRIWFWPHKISYVPSIKLNPICEIFLDPHMNWTENCLCRLTCHFLPKQKYEW